MTYCIFGHVWGEVRERYQYCKNCGKARSVECPHKWVNTNKVERYILNKWATEKLISGYVIVMKCEICGEMKNHEIEY